MRRSHSASRAPRGRYLVFQLLLGGIVAWLMISSGLVAADRHVTCQPTPPDQLGPFYQPGAPMRTKVGEGYVLQGVVRSSTTCQPLAEALIEVWLAGPDGRYSDAYRASLKPNQEGHYQFESPVPVGYAGRPPHIHIRVTAAGHRTLVTQHYPAAGQTTATFDLVLRPQ